MCFVFNLNYFAIMIFKTSPSMTTFANVASKLYLWTFESQVIFHLLFAFEDYPFVTLQKTGQSRGLALFGMFRSVAVCELISTGLALEHIAGEDSH